MFIYYFADSTEESILENLSQQTPCTLISGLSSLRVSNTLYPFKLAKKIELRPLQIFISIKNDSELVEAANKVIKIHHSYCYLHKENYMFAQQWRYDLFLHQIGYAWQNWKSEKQWSAKIVLVFEKQKDEINMTAKLVQSFQNVSVPYDSQLLIAFFPQEDLELWEFFRLKTFPVFQKLMDFVNSTEDSQYESSFILNNRHDFFGRLIIATSLVSYKSPLRRLY